MSIEQPIYWDHIIYSEEPDEHGSYIAGLDKKATPQMIEAFNNEDDIHSICASKIFNVLNSFIEIFSSLFLIIIKANKFTIANTIKVIAKILLKI